MQLRADSRGLFAGEVRLLTEVLQLFGGHELRARSVRGAEVERCVLSLEVHGQIERVSIHRLGVLGQEECVHGTGRRDEIEIRRDAGLRGLHRYEAVANVDEPAITVAAGGLHDLLAVRQDDQGGIADARTKRDQVARMVDDAAHAAAILVGGCTGRRWRSVVS